MNPRVVLMIVLISTVMISNGSAKEYGDNFKKEGNTYTFGIPTYLNGSVYEPVDNTLISNGTHFKSTKNTFKAAFNANVSKNDAFIFEFHGASFTARPYSYTTDKEYKIKKPDVKAIGSGMSYENIFDGMTLNYTVTTFGIKEDLILYTKPVTTADTFSFSTIFDISGAEMYVDDHIWDNKTKTLTSSDIEFKQNGVPIFKLNKPYVIDAEYNITQIGYSISKKGNEFILETVVPMSVLNNARYPVRVDPTIVLTPTTGVINCQYNRNYPDYSDCGFGSSLIVSNVGGIGAQVAAFKLNTSVLNGHTISDAYIHTNIGEGDYEATQDTSIAIYKITSDWGLSTSNTWNTRPTYNPTKINSTMRYDAPMNVYVWYNFSITNLVQEWASTPSSNYGMWIKNESDFTPGDIRLNLLTSELIVTLNNNIPTISSNYITPSNPTISSTLTANVETFDADSDSVSVSYLWYKNNISTGVTTSTLWGLESGSYYYVNVTPYDGIEYGVTNKSTVVTTPTTDPSYVSLDHWTFDLKNSAFISIPYLFNATNFTNTVTGELQFYLNGSKIQWRTNTNKSITSIRYNNISDVYSFNVSGTSGYLSLSAMMKNTSANYYLYVDRIATATDASDSSGNILFNYTGSWSDHEFIINSTNTTISSPPLSGNATTNNYYIYLGGVFQINTTSPFFNATGLTSNTTYSIGVRSHNNTYNSFGTWVNSTITTDAEIGINYDTASGLVLNSLSGLPLSSARVETTQGIVWTNINGQYSYGSVFIHGSSYVFNISKSGFISNITSIEFTSGDNTVHDVSLVPYFAPSLISWTNNFTNTNSVAIDITGATGIQFAFTSNQLLTSCVWTGVDSSEGYNSSTCTAYRNVSTGYEIITGYGSNSNGSTSTITWVVAIPGLTTPSIASFVSDVAGASEYIQVSSGTPITFTVTAPGATSFTWYIDHKEKAGHTSSYIYTPTGYHTISVVARNGYGDSSMKYKNIVISQLTAVALIPDINTSDYDTLENLIDAPDLVNIINFVPSPYTHFMGNTFYLILWALIGLMIWIRSDKITVPTTLGFIIGGVVIGMLPAQYQLVAQLIIVSGLFAALFILFKEKR